MNTAYKNVSIFSCVTLERLMEESNMHFHLEGMSLTIPTASE